MEERQSSGVTKVLLVLILIFCMVIAGMIGFGITSFNSAINGPVVTDDKTAQGNGEGQGKNDAAKERVTEKKEVFKLPNTQTDSKLADERIADLSDVVEAAMPSLVAITTEGEESINSWFGKQIRKTKNMGSGVIIDKDENSLFIITNNHVVEGAKHLMVTFNDGRTVKGKVRGTAAYTDLALVEVKLSDLDKKSVSNVKVAKIGLSDNLKVGQMVMAIGNALGYGQSLTVGYVSAKDRIVTVNDITMKLIQTDAAINPGNSGGALLNLNGEVIGINSVKFSSEAVEGMGYAIPMVTVRPLINELKSSKKLVDSERGYLGIFYREIDESSHEAFNLPYGLYISDVAKNGGAKKAGLLKGDIIIGLNDNETLKSDAINSIILGKRKGDKVKVTFYRYENGDYVKKEVIVTLSEKPEVKN